MKVKQTRYSQTSPNSNDINTAASLRMALYPIQLLSFRKLTDNGRINLDACPTALFNGSWYKQGKQNLFTMRAILYNEINPLTPNDHYSGRTAPLTSKRCILYIYSTNIDTEYFKHGI